MRRRNGTGPARKIMKAAGLAAAVLAAVAAVIVLAAAPAAGKDGASPLPQWSGDRTVPPHVFPLRDENNRLIVPGETNPLPYSARYTCGPCHDYDTVKSGWHFNAAAAPSGGRPGEPWFWVDAKTGTAWPLSYRRWPGTWDPRALGLTGWDFTNLFGRHMPGGGVAEPSADEAGDPASRWNVSGAAEVNCLACHNASGRQDPSEWAKQMGRQNYRWAATAAAGLGEVGGMASRLRDTWDVFDGPNPDDHEWAVVPTVKYDPARFDSKHRAFLDIGAKPDSARCLACHSVSPSAAERWSTESDVHMTSGLACVDCHRNGLTHDIVRGYPAEASESGVRDAAGFTCRGCHLGEDAEGRKTVVPGRLGAPVPKHTGLPLAHFRKLACTVCHAGPSPEAGPTRVRTARANRLGIHGAAQWWTDAPAIVEPVYTRDADGFLTPSRLAWPAGWVRIEGKTVTPVRPETVAAATSGIFDGEDRAARLLTAISLALGEDEIAVLLGGGFVFEVNADGGLDARPAPADAPRSGFGISKAGTVRALLPEFDPAAEDKDPEIEPRIQQVLQSVAAQVTPLPGQPVFVARKTLYRMTDGSLEAAPLPAGVAEDGRWGWVRDGGFAPAMPEADLRALTAKAGREETLTEEQVALGLKALAADAAASGGGRAAEFGYVSGGRLFRLGADGTLDARDDPAAAPVTWPMAHDVRPAQQSLGVHGCGDCHSAGSKFFFAEVRGAGPLLTSRAESRPAHRFMKLTGIFQRLFGLTFTVRPMLKIVLIACAALLGSLILLAFLAALGRVSGLLEKR